MSHQNNSQNSGEPRRPGWGALIQHVIEHKVDVAIWATRVFTVLFTIGYFIPLLGNPYHAYYKALISNAASTALRLHQRVPRATFNRESLSLLLPEDSCHYLAYSLIFLYVTPVTLVLLPVFMFALLQSTSYFLTLLDTFGQNSWWGARLLISLVEFQSRNILRLVAFTEIILFPFTIVLIFLGRAVLLTPFIYYHFLTLRYLSRRNPYNRMMFHELRLLLENTASKPGTPSFLRNILLSVVAYVSRFGPPSPQAQ